MRVRAGDRILVLGTTGAGKSTLASAIANRWQRVLVLDPKDDPGAVLPNSRVAYGVRDALSGLPGRVVYRPLPDELGPHSDTLAERDRCHCLRCSFDRLCRRVYLSGGTGILLHETADVAPSAGARRWLNACIRMGRSRGIPVIFCAQRPGWIDRLALSEPAHVYLFKLWDPRDLSVAAGLFGVSTSALPPLSLDHRFHYRGPGGVVYTAGPVRA